MKTDFWLPQLPALCELCWCSHLPAHSRNRRRRQLFQFHDLLSSLAGSPCCHSVSQGCQIIWAGFDFSRRLKGGAVVYCLVGTQLRQNIVHSKSLLKTLDTSVLCLSLFLSLRRSWRHVSTVEYSMVPNWAPGFYEDKSDGLTCYHEIHHGIFHSVNTPLVQFSLYFGKLFNLFLHVTCCINSCFIVLEWTLFHWVTL
jgi:hypothetical protein